MANKKEFKVMTWLNNGCYPGYVMFSCGFKYDEIVKLLKRKDHGEHWITGISEDKDFIDKGNYFGLRRDIENLKTGKELRLFYIIITEQFKFTDYEMCKLAHEVVHIEQFFLKDILDRNVEIEASAYYHTHIMNQCLEALRGNAK